MRGGKPADRIKRLTQTDMEMTGEKVVFDHVNDGQFEDRSEIERFMEYAFLGCAISEIAYGDPACFVHFGRQRGSRGNRNGGAHDRHRPVEVIGAIKQVH